MKKIGVEYFVFLHGEDPCGHNFAYELRGASLKENIKMESIAIDPDLSNIVHSINVIKSTEYNCTLKHFSEKMLIDLTRFHFHSFIHFITQIVIAIIDYFLSLVFTIDVLCSLCHKYLDSGLVISEAIKQGIVHDRQWFFSYNYNSFNYQENSGVDERQFVEFYNNTGNIFYKTTIRDDSSAIFEKSIQEILNDDGDSIKSMLPQTLDVNWKRFSSLFKKHTGSSLYNYEAAIMLGLSACNAAGTNLNVSSLDGTNDGLYLNSTALYREMVNMYMHNQLTGDVIRLNNRTGTRVPETAHFGMCLSIL